MTLKEMRKVGTPINLTNEQAIKIFGTEIVRLGGGWVTIDGVDVYGRDGSHRNGHRGFQIKQIGHW